MKTFTITIAEPDLHYLAHIIATEIRQESELRRLVTGHRVSVHRERTLTVTNEALTKLYAIESAVQGAQLAAAKEANP